MNGPYGAIQDCAPYGILQGMQPGQEPLYFDQSIRQGNGNWGQRRGRPRYRDQNQPMSYHANHHGEGQFGVWDASTGGPYRNIYAGDATTDPNWRPHEWGNPGRQGYGELIPGIDGGAGYGYRSMDSRWAEADWGDRMPHIPGRGGMVANEVQSAPNAFQGYWRAATYPNGIDPREYNAAEMEQMQRQLQHDNGGRVMDWYGPGDGCGPNDLEERLYGQLDAYLRGQ